MSKNDMVMVPVDLMESAINAFGSIGMHDQLDQLNEILGAPAQQHQGEPVALPARKHHVRADYSQDILAEGWNACLDEIAKLGPLYTHADPAEVEQLRERMLACEEIAENNAKACAEALTKLAEAHALLSEIEGCPWVVEDETIPKAGIEAAPEQVVGTMHMGLMRLRRIRAWLSASAEPSAPVDATHYYPEAEPGRQWRKKVGGLWCEFCGGEVAASRCARHVARVCRNRTERAG